MISKVTLENYMKYFLLENNKKFSKNTSITYKINLNQYLNFYDDKYNDLENLIHYKMHLEECYKPVTVKNKLRILHVYYAYLEKKKFVDISPFKQTMFELPAEETKMRVLTEETLKILEDYMIKKMHTKNHYHRKLIIRNYAIIEIILITGIRLSELCCLKKLILILIGNKYVLHITRKKGFYHLIQNVFS